MTLAILRDEDGSFWEQNKALAYMSPFAEFKKTDKKSDIIMKAIYLAYDSKSRFYNMSLSEKQEDISKHLIKDAKFNWADYEEIIEAYKDKCRTDAQKRIDEIRDELDEISQSMSVLSFEDEEEYKQRIALADFRDKQVQRVIDLEAKIKEEIGELELYGDYYPSVIENYEISSNRGLG